MHKNVVVGCGGSGKSVIARELGHALDLPIVHLDGV
jgi:shikimate kinase